MTEAPLSARVPHVGPSMSPAQLRALCRSEHFTAPTAGLASGHVQANLVVLPAALAGDFEAFCQQNSKPCPLLERLPAGDPQPRRLAPGADVRTDLPRYRCYRRDGSHSEHLSICDLWSEQSVAFLLGCSFSFEEALTAAGLVPRHIEQGLNVPMYRTGLRTTSVGPFGGALVVSMRPIPVEQVATAYVVTRPYAAVHGEPVYHGDPSGLGIRDLSAPEWGDNVTIRDGETPVFWACGVTSQEAVMGALRQGAVERAITHAPGHMLVTDILSTDLIDEAPVDRSASQR